MSDTWIKKIKKSLSKGADNDILSITLVFDYNTNRLLSFSIIYYHIFEDKIVNIYCADNAYKNEYHEDLYYTNPPQKHKKIEIDSSNIFKIYRWAKTKVERQWETFLKNYMENHLS